MDKHQSNFYRMLLTVTELFIASAQVLSGLPALGRAFGRLQNKVSELETVEEAKGNKTTGKGKRKKNSKFSLAMIASKVAAAVFTYASEKELAELQANMDLSEWKLVKMKDSDILATAGSIQKSAAPLIAELAEHGVNAEDITLLQESINTFKQLMGQVGAGKSTGSTKDTAIIISEIRAILKVMDKSVDTLKGTNLSFYNKYQSARNIIDYGIRHEEKEETPQQPA